jgi:hypothetical protein
MNLLPTIVAKSDQLNADDLVGGPRTITVTAVKGSDSPDQPVSIHYEGDQGKPYKPCKTCRRVLVHCWGPEAKEFVGRRMTLYKDPDVMFGGIKVGGIRISHLSHIEREVAVALMVTRGKRAPYIVKPLAAQVHSRSEAQRSAPPHDDDFPGDRGGFDVLAWADDLESKLPDYAGVDPLREDWQAHKDDLKARDLERFKDLNQKIARRAAEIAEGV